MLVKEELLKELILLLLRSLEKTKRFPWEESISLFALPRLPQFAHGASLCPFLPSALKCSHQKNQHLTTCQEEKGCSPAFLLLHRPLQGPLYVLWKSNPMTNAAQHESVTELAGAELT